MYIKGDIFIDSHYPLYFGIGYRKFEERVKGVGADWFVELRNLMNLAVVSISVQGNHIPSDNVGNVDLNVPTKEEFDSLKEKVENDKDKMYDFSFIEETETLQIISKQNV